jgi:hypothetical protein
VRRFFLFFSASAALAVGCVAALPHAQPADVLVAQTKWKDASLESLEQGRLHYVRKCGGCHALYQPSDRKPEEWPGVLDEMEVEAKLTPDDRQRIEQFLITLSLRSHATISAAAR